MIFNDGPTIKERDIWWCSIGVNIGDEIDGKNELFHRPVLILKKFSSELCLVAPTSAMARNMISSSTGSHELF